MKCLTVSDSVSQAILTLPCERREYGGQRDGLGLACDTGPRISL
jgi:hypothetical protein